MKMGNNGKQNFGRSRKRDIIQGIKKMTLIGGSVVVMVTLVIIGVKSVKSNEQNMTNNIEETTDDMVAPINETMAMETLSAEEIEKNAIEEKINSVVASYKNIGIAQVSGYVNIRNGAGPDGEIIGKLEGNSACNILKEEGDWYYIATGGVEGYIAKEYILSGEEAKQLARTLVSEKAIIQTHKLNVRSEAVIDPSNVTDHVFENERYEIESVSDEWIKIPQGYISSEYVVIEQALNEGKKLDLRMMAVDQYDNILISKVKGYMNVRKEPSTEDDSNIIGKLPGKAAGEIIETLDGWYKIKSGNITGYVSSDPEYVAVGQEAINLALEHADLMAIVNVDKLNVRVEPSTEVDAWTQISKEERYPIVSQLDGWVEIELDSGDDGELDRSFVSTESNYVEVRYALLEAIKFSPLEEAINEQSSLRNKVVNYALQFVGNPYVWGGTNPNTGADCSGFVQYVLKNVAGVSIPRVSRDQAKAGREISSSEMRPGDLIFYAGSSGVINHVSMYIGNGQIVHAANTASGIKISTWNYRTPKYIRNVID